MIRRLLIVFCGAFAAIAFAADADSEIGVRLHDIRISHNGRTIRLSLAIFDEKKFSIRIVDNAAPGDQPRFASLAIAMDQLGCVAGCNGGFFTRHPFDPFGLMISEGREFGTFDPASWMNGLLIIRDGKTTLEPCSSLKGKSGITGLLQAGPWLIRQGTPEPNLDKDRYASRTFVCRNDHGIWAIGASDPCTPQELASLLTSAVVKDAIEIQQALNLDGGPSTGLWLKQSPANFYVREGWPVRNYVGVVPRP